MSETRLHPRHLEWEGLINARDTGGLETADGPIKQGALVRSDLLNSLTPGGVTALTEHGVRTVIDVRSVDEVAHDWARYPLKEHPLVGYVNQPFRSGVPDEVRAQARAAYSVSQSRADVNRTDLDYFGRGITSIVAAIADAPPGGVLVHCHAGKDRTGIVIALALAAVGVSDDDIADDYALTELVLEPLIADWLDFMSQDPEERALLRRQAVPSKEAMLETLAYLRERYGGAERYLLEGGMTNDQLARLRARLVDANESQAA